MSTSRTSKLAQAASTALAHASAKLAGEPNVVQEIAAEAEVSNPPRVSEARAADLRSAYLAAKEAMDAAKGAILAEMGTSDILLIAETGALLAENVPTPSSVFDKTRFRADHPELPLDDYMKPRVTRRFKVLT